jgi:hypothetical protein
MKYCVIVGCEKPVHVQWLCHGHYLKKRRYGDPNLSAKDFRPPKPRSRKSEYVSWYSMKYRCTNTKAQSYMYYGARGIKVCDRWLESFDNFFEDMGFKPSPKHSLDRIDPFGNYTPENCRWSNKNVQSLNRSHNTEHPGVYQRKRFWVAAIIVDGKHVYKENFTSLEEALKARRKAERKWLEK